MNHWRCQRVYETPDLVEPYSQGVGFACADPMQGRSPRARPGELCPEWLWPLMDPGLVIPNDARYLERRGDIGAMLANPSHGNQNDRDSHVHGDVGNLTGIRK